MAGVVLLEQDDELDLSSRWHHLPRAGLGSTWDGIYASSRDQLGNTDGRLFLALMADGGIYEFEPAGTQGTQPGPLPCGEATFNWMGVESTCRPN